MKEEEFYQKELNLFKEKLSEVKKKVNINRQKNKKLRDKRETLLVDTVLKAGDLTENLQKIEKFKEDIEKLEDEFKDLKTIIRGLELREKIFKSIISEKIENFWIFLSRNSKQEKKKNADRDSTKYDECKSYNHRRSL